MTEVQIAPAAGSNVPFILRMADDRESPVLRGDYLPLPPAASYVILGHCDSSGTPTVAP